MYIPYEKIGNILYKFIKNDRLKDYFYNKKISQNLSFIEKNQKKVIKKLQKKYKNNQRINIVFYLYDIAKWKCQSLYDLLDKDKRFNVKVLVTKNSAKNLDNPSYQTNDEILKLYQKLKDKNYNVELAYDIKNNKHIPFKKYNPDIIIYQHPWYVETSQGPVICSKFALTYYIPYFVANAGLKEDYYLRFHKYIQKHCVLNKTIADFYSSKMDNNGKNLLVVGHPQLDFFYLNKKDIKNEKYVIYAPHWTLLGKNLAYGTFEWSGKFMLEYAKNHPEINWVFKPHPLLKKSIIDENFMDKNEIENYYDNWAKLGLKCEDNNYLELFKNSILMITDCGSFLSEYFLTKNPLIRIVSKYPHDFCPHYNKIIENYYNVYDIKNLEKTLDDILINKIDTMKEKRLKAVKNCNFSNTYCAKNIIEDIIKAIS